MGEGAKLAVLNSGFGLGFHIPGLLLHEKIRRLGVESSVEVFESLLPDSKLELVEKNRSAYHSNFNVALASQRVPSDIRRSWDKTALESLLLRWQEQNIGKFIVLSGHWVHVLALYREMRLGLSIQAHLLYLDAALAPSWKQLRKIWPNYAESFQEVELYDLAARKILCCIDTNAGTSVPYSQRNGRLVVHGGGWGIGTYRERAAELENRGYGLDIACYEEGDIMTGPASRQYFMDDPRWRSWHRDVNGEHPFPPFGRVESDLRSTTFAPQYECNGLHKVIRQAAGIVSKPGAGTLIDSINSATPLIMLEPFGPHEEANGELWEGLGLGIRYPNWAETGFQFSVLEKIHANLLAQKAKAADYAENCLAIFK